MLLSARRLAAVGLVLATALLCATASFARSTTTQPGKTVLVYFVITDQKIAYEILRTTAAGGSDLYLEKYVVRGDFAKFTVINRGKKPHGFAFMGKKFSSLRPGRSVRFSKSLLVRGVYPFRSPTDRGKAFKGKFPVY